MPRYQERVTDLIERGPNVFLTLARPERVQLPEGASAAAEMPDVRALIDTGATYCAIRASLADELGLQQHDERPIGNAGGTDVCPIYLVDLIFSDGIRRSFEAAGCSFRGQSIEFILGRNFLAVAMLTYDGRVGTFSLEFE